MNSSYTKKARTEDQFDRTEPQVPGDERTDKGNGEET